MQNPEIPAQGIAHTGRDHQQSRGDFVLAKDRYPLVCSSNPQAADLADDEIYRFRQRAPHRRDEPVVEKSIVLAVCPVHHVPLVHVDDFIEGYGGSRQRCK